MQTSNAGASLQQLNRLFDGLAQGIIVCDRFGIVSYVNRHAERVLNLKAAAMLNRPAFESERWQMIGLDGHKLPPASRPWRRALKRAKPQRKRTIGLIRGQRTAQWLDAEAVPVAGPEGVEHVVVSFVERGGAAVAAPRGLYDAITGLPTLDLLNDRVQQAIAITRRNRGRSALVLLDLDRFRDVNETFGHQAGDLLLKMVAERLKSALRDSDTLGRVVGDQFAAVLLDVGSEGRAELCAGRLLDALELPFEVEGQPVNLGASIGIALLPDHASDPQTALGHALAAMYVAKRDHCGFALYRDEHDPHTANRIRLRSELRRAIEQDELVLFYQPKIAFHAGHPMFVEALLRWQHPERGLVPPIEFIEFAEESGLIQPLTRWVLQAALKQTKAWVDRGIELGVAVNLSAHNLHDPQLMDTVRGLLDEWRIPARLLRLEVTESALMSQPERMLDVLHELSALGIDLSIDDFGTGFSSLSYLNRLPVNELKIDQSFVKNLASSEHDEVIVRSTIDLGHNLGLVVVAEGVEDASVWTKLGHLGCDAGQGFYMARPMPSDQLNRWLGESPWAALHSALPAAS